MSEEAPTTVETGPSDENANREKPSEIAEETPKEANGEDQPEAEETEDKEKEGDEAEAPAEDGLDDDQREDNPAYIPRDKRYYMHDSRVSSSDAEEENDEEGEKRRSRADCTWSHDRFDERWQRPKTRKQLMNKYGFDIRVGENGEEIEEKPQPKRPPVTRGGKVRTPREEAPAERVERPPQKVQPRGRGMGRGTYTRSARPPPPPREEEHEEEYEDEEEEETQQRRPPRYSDEMQGGRRRAPPPRNQAGYRDVGRAPAPSGRGRYPSRGGYSTRPQRQENDDYEEEQERDTYKERPAQFRRGTGRGRGQPERSGYAQVPYRQRGIPTRGGGGRYPRGGSYGGRGGATHQERESTQQHGSRAFHNQSYSRGGPRRGDGTHPTRSRDDHQGFKNNDRDFPPLARGGGGGGQEGSSQMHHQVPVFDRTRPPPMPTGGPKRYSTQQRPEAPQHVQQGQNNQNNFIPRQPTAVVYFDPNAQPRPQVPPQPRQKKIIDIVPPKH